MNVSKLFLPFALLCSIPSHYLVSMEKDTDDTQELIWVKDNTFPTPKDKKQTQSRWVQVPAQPELLQSKLAESVALGELSLDDAKKASKNIQEAFEKKQSDNIQDFELGNQFTRNALRASITALTKQRDVYNSKQPIAQAVRKLEEARSTYAKDMYFAIKASEKQNEIIELENIIEGIDQKYQRIYKTTEQAQADAQADAQAKKSWWKFFSRSK